MVRYGTAYVDAGQQAYEQKYRDRVLTNLQRKAKAFGYQLVHVADIDGGDCLDALTWGSYLEVLSHAEVPHMAQGVCQQLPP